MYLSKSLSCVLPVHRSVPGSRSSGSETPFFINPYGFAWREKPGLRGPQVRTKARGVVCFGGSGSLPRLTYSIGAGCWWSQWWSACLEVKTRALSTVQGFFHPTGKRCQQVYSRKNFCLPTKLCFLLSHRGAARTPLVTRAKKAFFTYSQKSEILRRQGRRGLACGSMRCEEGHWASRSEGCRGGKEPHSPAGKYQTQPTWSSWGSGRSSDETSWRTYTHHCSILGSLHMEKVYVFYARTYSQKRKKTKKSSSFSTLKIFLLCFYCFSSFH